MAIDVAQELVEAFKHPELRKVMIDLFRDAVRAEQEDDVLLNANEAATVMSMTAAGVRKAAERGTLPCRKVGRSLRFKKSELLARLGK